MIDMSHDADYWRSWNKCRRIVLIILDELGDDIDLFLMLTDAVELGCYILSLIKIDF